MHLKRKRVVCCEGAEQKGAILHSFRKHLICLNIFLNLKIMNKTTAYSYFLLFFYFHRMCFQGLLLNTNCSLNQFMEQDQPIKMLQCTYSWCDIVFLKNKLLRKIVRVAERVMVFCKGFNKDALELSTSHYCSACMNTLYSTYGWSMIFDDVMHKFIEKATKLDESLIFDTHVYV